MGNNNKSQGLSTTDRLPVTIITGFLGAGKTTLVRNLLEQIPHKRVAMIINDFGDFNVDENLIANEDNSETNCSAKDLIALSGECICCSLEEDFIPSVKSILEKNNLENEENPITNIIVETSGLALPQPLISALQWPEIRSKVIVDGVISVVDGEALFNLISGNNEMSRDEASEGNFPQHSASLMEIYLEQLECADLVLLNKTDLMTESQLHTTEAYIDKNTSDKTRLIRTRHSKIDSSVALGEPALVSANFVEHEDHEDHHHPTFYSQTIFADDIDKVEDFERLLHNFTESNDILRMKGFLCVKGKPTKMIIQVVGKRINIYFEKRNTFAKKENDNVLVVISSKPLEKDTINKALFQSN